MDDEFIDGSDFEGFESLPGDDDVVLVGDSTDDLPPEDLVSEEMAVAAGDDDVIFADDILDDIPS